MITVMSRRRDTLNEVRRIQSSEAVVSIRDWVRFRVK